MGKLMPKKRQPDSSEPKDAAGEKVAMVGGLWVYDCIPKGWGVMRSPSEAPPGYTAICNQKNRHSSEFRRGLVSTKSIKSINGVRVYAEIPPGWSTLRDAAGQPNGYVMIWNRKSRFSGKYKNGLVLAKNVR